VLAIGEHGARDAMDHGHEPVSYQRRCTSGRMRSSTRGRSVRVDPAYRRSGSRGGR
jgi:hypothetical protein